MTLSGKRVLGSHCLGSHDAVVGFKNKIVSRSSGLRAAGVTEWKPNLKFISWKARPLEPKIERSLKLSEPAMVLTHYGWHQRKYRSPSREFLQRGVVVCSVVNKRVGKITKYWYSKIVEIMSENSGQLEWKWRESDHRIPDVWVPFF